MTMNVPAQPQLFCEATAARRSGKISVPVGYKFSPNHGDLINHHLKRKLMNLPEQHCLIPEHNHYEAEPWDLITKYNELSDGESNIDECFFYSTNNSSKRVNRKTPKGHWNETSGKKTIQGTDGVECVLRYFTFYSGQRKKRDSTPWRMREFIHPSNKELALCKIFKDVGSQNKKNDGRSSVIPEPSTSMPISSGCQTPEAYADMAREAQTPTSANLTNNLVSQCQQKPFDETPYCVISPHEQHAEERHLPSQNAFDDQFFDFNNPRQHDQLSDPKLMKDVVISPHHQPLTYTKEGFPLAQNIYDDEYNKDWLYSHNVTLNIGDVPHSKRPHMAEGEGTSLEASQQPPMKKSRISVTNSQNLELAPSDFRCSLQPAQMGRERNFSSTNNSLLNSSMVFPQGNNMHTGYGYEEVNSEEVASRANPPTQPRSLNPSNYMVPSHQIADPVLDSHDMLQEIEELLTWQSNGISFDDLPMTNGTNIEGHSNESTVSLSPSNYSACDQVNTSEPTGIENHEEQQPIQQQELPGLSSLLHSATQHCNTTAQKMDKPTISEEWYNYNECSGQEWFYSWDTQNEVP